MNINKYTERLTDHNMKDIEQSNLYGLTCNILIISIKERGVAAFLYEN